MAEDRQDGVALEAQQLVAGYDGPPVLDGVEVSVRRGRVTVVLGPNGAGKSTLAKAIIGLLTVRSGTVMLDGKDVTNRKAHELVRTGLAYLPQLSNIFDELTILENLEMGGFTFRGDLKKRIEEVMGLFPDLSGVRKKRAGQLSGGQQRMVALARVLMTDPLAAILDEPTAGLSPQYAERVWAQVLRIRESGVGLLVVEQNAKLAMENADDVYVLARGRNVVSGPAAELAQREEVASILVG